MPDIAIAWDTQNSRGDWTLVNGDLATGADLEAAVMVSIFSDRDAGPDYSVSEDRRGWWADAYEPQPIGSRIWTLERSKKTDAVLAMAKGYAAEALGWLVTDGLAASVDVVTEWQGTRLAIGITITEPDGKKILLNYGAVWGEV